MVADYVLIPGFTFVGSSFVELVSCLANVRLYSSTVITVSKCQRARSLERVSQVTQKIGNVLVSRRWCFGPVQNPGQKRQE